MTWTDEELAPDQEPEESFEEQAVTDALLYEAHRDMYEVAEHYVNLEDDEWDEPITEENKAELQRSFISIRDHLETSAVYRTHQRLIRAAMAVHKQS